MIKLRAVAGLAVPGPAGVICLRAQAVCPALKGHPALPGAAARPEAGARPASGGRNRILTVAGG